jgi:sortase B
MYYNGKNGSCQDGKEPGKINLYRKRGVCKMSKKGKSEAAKDRKRARRTEKGASIVFVIAIGVFLVSGIQLVRMLLPYYQGGQVYKEVQQLVIVNEPEEEGGEAEVQVDFPALLEQNSDTIGWIRFDKPEAINYPIVKSVDNQDYLTKTFNGASNSVGTIFMDMRNSSDFKDRNTLIYGHNLQIGGEMFSQLVSYQSAEFYQENPYFYIFTPTTTYKYQIFAVSIVKDMSENYKIDFASNEEYMAFIAHCKGTSLYDTGVEPVAGTRVVSLSTCTNVVQDDRLLVQAVLVQEKTP